jgi:hypothetical protein
MVQSNPLIVLFFDILIVFIISDEVLACFYCSAFEELTKPS